MHMRLLLSIYFFSFSLPITDSPHFPEAGEQTKNERHFLLSDMHLNRSEKNEIKTEEFNECNPCPKKSNHKIANTMRIERAVKSYFASNYFDSLLMKFFLWFSSSFFFIFPILPTRVALHFCHVVLLHALFSMRPPNSHVWKHIFFSELRFLSFRLQ